MNNILLDFLNSIASSEVEWELKITYSKEYNQVKTVFENGWGVSIVFEDNGNISVEISYIDENFFSYHDFNSISEVIEEVIKTKEY